MVLQKLLGHMLYTWIGRTIDNGILCAFLGQLNLYDFVIYVFIYSLHFCLFGIVKSRDQDKKHGKRQRGARYNTDGDIAVFWCGD